MVEEADKIAEAIKAELENTIFRVEVGSRIHTNTLKQFAHHMVVTALQYELCRIDEGLDGGGIEEWITEEWIKFQEEQKSGPHREADPDNRSPSG